VRQLLTAVRGQIVGALADFLVGLPLQRLQIVKGQQYGCLAPFRRRPFPLVCFGLPGFFLRAAACRAFVERRRTDLIVWIAFVRAVFAFVRDAHVVDSDPADRPLAPPTDAVEAATV